MSSNGESDEQPAGHGLRTVYSEAVEAMGGINGGRERSLTMDQVNAAMELEQEAEAQAKEKAAERKQRRAEEKKQEEEEEQVREEAREAHRRRIEAEEAALDAMYEEEDNKAGSGLEDDGAEDTGGGHKLGVTLSEQVIRLTL